MGHTGYRGYPAAFRLEDWGLSRDEAGSLGDRRWGRNYHFTAAWVFLINGGARQLDGTRELSVVLMVFGVMAVLLAVLGVYGMVTEMLG